MRQKPFTISLLLTKNTNTRTSFTNRHLADIRRKQRVLTRRRTATASDSGLDGCAECELEATTWSDEMPHKPGRILHCWVPTAPSGNADNSTQRHRLLVKNIYDRLSCLDVIPACERLTDTQQQHIASRR